MLSVEQIRTNITTDKVWAIRALLAVYRYQTEDEKSAETTTHHNGIGFNGADANILSSFAKQVIERQPDPKTINLYCLSTKQYEILFKKIGKYAGQLAKVQTEKENNNEE